MKELDKTPVKALHEIIALDPSYAKDPRRCRAMLNDYLKNKYSKEINLLTYAIETRAVQILIDSAHEKLNSLLPPGEIIRLSVARFESETGLRPPESSWAIGAWAEVLGIIHAINDNIISDNKFKSLTGNESSERYSINANKTQLLDPARLFNTLSERPDKKSIHPGALTLIKLRLNLQSIELRFHWCPPGTFVMGSPKLENGHCKNEKSVSVSISKGFGILETPVTQGLYIKVTGENPSCFKGSPQLPVECVSWVNANNFCQKVNAQFQKDNSVGYRIALPTEAQWEYACRSGSDKAYYFGNNNTKLSEFAWFSKNTRCQSHPVGLKRPNAWGLYDMHGNVCEWTADAYKEELPGGVDPSVSGNRLSNRVHRGGAWAFDAEFCRSSYRHQYDPINTNNCIGFRLALTPSSGSNLYKSD